MGGACTAPAGQGGDETPKVLGVEVRGDVDPGSSHRNVEDRRDARKRGPSRGLLGADRTAQPHVNTWPCCSEELAGPFVPTEAMGTTLRSLEIQRWSPSPGARRLAALERRTPKRWREHAL